MYNRLMRKAILILAVLVSCSTAAFCGPLEIHHINVGQGDCTLIVSPDGKTTVLIDAGDNGLGAKAVLPYLKKQKIDHLTYIFASHYDADHIGGLDEVIAGIGAKKIGTVYDRGAKPAPPTTVTYKDYARAAGADRKTLKLGQVINLRAGVSLICVAQNGVVTKKKPVPGAAANENNLCVGLLLTFKKFRYFTAGDSGGEKDGEYVDVETPVSGVIGHVNAMKVNHHGSASSSNSVFLKKLSPTVAMIDVGDDNRHSHPSQPALDRLVEAKCAIYQTEKGSGGKVSKPGCCTVAGGAIKLTTDGLSRFSVTCIGKPAKAFAIK